MQGLQLFNPVALPFVSEMFVLVSHYLNDRDPEVVKGADWAVGFSVRLCMMSLRCPFRQIWSY